MELDRKTEQLPTMTRTSYTAAYKARLAVDAMRGRDTISQIASSYEVHPTQVGRWKKQALEHVKAGLGKACDEAMQQGKGREKALYAENGRLKMELSWLKTTVTMPIPEKRSMVGHAEGSIQRQCELLGIPRFTWYHKPTGKSDYEQRLMRIIHDAYSEIPVFSVRWIRQVLRHRGHVINPKRVHRLMRLMGLQASRPKRRYRPDSGHYRHPNLIKQLPIVQADQAWCVDTTHIRMDRDCGYLVTVMGCFSQYVLSWTLSNTQEAAKSAPVYEDALAISQPEIFHSDHRAQYSSDAIMALSMDAGVRISMCGRGRCYDDILNERLWRSVKDEEMYLNEYGSLHDTGQRLHAYFERYHHCRPRQTLQYRTPAEAYCSSDEVNEPVTEAGPMTASPRGPSPPHSPRQVAMHHLNFVVTLSNEWGTPYSMG